MVRKSLRQLSEQYGSQLYILVRHSKENDTFYFEGGVHDLSGARAALVNGTVSGKSFQHGVAHSQCARALTETLKVLQQYVATTKPEVELK